MKKLTAIVLFCGIAIGIILALDEKGILGWKLIERIFSGNLENVGTDTPTSNDNATVDRSTSPGDNRTPIPIPENPASPVKVGPTEEEVDTDPEEKSGRNQKFMALYKKGKFAECYAAIEKHPEQNAELAQLKEKSRICLLLTGDIGRKGQLRGDATKFVMMDGKEYIGEILSQNTGEIKIKTFWGTLPLPRHKIRSQSAISLKDYQKEQAGGLRKRLKNMESGNNSEALKLITEATENNLDSAVYHIVRELEEKDAKILPALVELKANRIYQSYLWCDTMGDEERGKPFLNTLLNKFGDTTAARDAREFLAKPKPPKPLKPLVIKEPKPDPKNPQKIDKPAQKVPVAQPRLTGAAAAAFIKGNEYYQAGYAHLKKSFPGEPNADDELQLARKDFQNACKYYQQALDASPNDKDVESQLQQATEFLEHCIKQTRLK